MFKFYIFYLSVTGAYDHMLFVFIFNRAISHMMSSLVYPLVTFVLLVVCVAYWGATALYPFNVMYACVHTVCLYAVILLCTQFYSTITSAVQSIGSSLKLVFVDIWRLQETQSTEWWLSTPLMTAGVSMAR